MISISKEITAKVTEEFKQTSIILENYNWQTVKEILLSHNHQNYVKIHKTLHQNKGIISILVQEILIGT